MNSTTFLLANATVSLDGKPSNRCPSELRDQFESVIREQPMHWAQDLRLTKLLGKGRQGYVFLSERRGADSFRLPVALKFFSPEPFLSWQAYDEAMSHMAHVAMRVARIQQDHLLDVQNFLARSRIRVMEMEWIDGYDAEWLLAPGNFTLVEKNTSQRTWEHLNKVVFQQGPEILALKPGVAMTVMRECLAGLGALHRENIVHGDIKPSNIMIKKTGNAKLVDVGSAIDLNSPSPVRTCTPTYAAPEVLEEREWLLQSDLASLGYVLIEILSGRRLFVGCESRGELLEAKRALPQKLGEYLPAELLQDKVLLSFVRKLIAPDPLRRFKTALDADLEGAAAFSRQLIKGDLASEFSNDIRVWLEAIDDALDQPS